MTRHNASNEQIKRQYLAFLKHAKCHDEATVDAVANRARRGCSTRYGRSCPCASLRPVPLCAHVLRPLPHRDRAHVSLRTAARSMQPSPGQQRLGSRVVDLSRLQFVAPRASELRRRRSKLNVRRVQMSNQPATPDPTQNKRAPGNAVASLIGCTGRALRWKVTTAVSPSN